MFLSVSVRHVGAHPDEHQHGVSIQISINLGRTSQNVSSNISYTNYSFDLNLGEGLCICTSFHFPDSGLYLLNGFDFYFNLFWMAWHWKPAIFPLGYCVPGDFALWFSSFVFVLYYALLLSSRLINFINASAGSRFSSKQPLVQGEYGR